MPAACALLLLTLAGADGDLLRARLVAGEPVRIVLLGDSITDGFDLAEPERDRFAALFCGLLREAWPAVTFDPVVRGEPGAPSREALLNFDLDVERYGPHLVVLQFGGNDKGGGDGLASLAGYEQNLRELIDRTRALGAAPLVMAPPMHEPVVHMPYPLAAAQVARSRAVPLVATDDLLKRPPLDYRGTFPYGVHPREHEHALMALALYDAFLELLGEARALEAELEDAALDAAPGATIDLPVRLANRLATPQRVQVALTGELPYRAGAAHSEATVDLPPGAEARLTLPLALPASLPGGRSAEYRLTLTARGDGQPAFSLKRLTIVPRVHCPALGTPAAEIAAAELMQSHLFAVADWRGPGDLSARLFLGHDDEAVRVQVEVTDDRLRAGTGVPYGDGIELYLDLRDEADRGRPFYTPLCATLMVTWTEPPAQPLVTTLEADRPPEGLLEVKPLQEPMRGGYRLTLDLPRALLDRAAGRRVERFGFDLAVDDSDEPDRQAQLLWLGRTDNFVNPRRLGELSLTPPPSPWRATVF